MNADQNLEITKCAHKGNLIEVANGGKWRTTRNVSFEELKFVDNKNYWDLVEDYQKDVYCRNESKFMVCICCMAEKQEGDILYDKYYRTGGTEETAEVLQLRIYYQYIGSIHSITFSPGMSFIIPTNIKYIVDWSWGNVYEVPQEIPPIEEPPKNFEQP